MIKSAKRGVLLTLGLTALILILLGGITFVIDPYCHYRKTPDEKIKTSYSDQRYLNDGIVRHFTYDAIITGSSMTENFKASEAGELFGVTCIKVPFSGGSYKEINGCLETAVSSNDSIKLIIRGLDYNRLLDTVDEMRQDESTYPDYLYNGTGLDDVKYLLNKDLLRAELYDIAYTILGRDTRMDFDEYCRWQDNYSFGAANIYYNRPEKANTISVFSEEDKANIRENIETNVLALATEHPEIQFYYFFTPYSIYYFDSLNQTGELNRQLEAEKYIIELLLPYENIHLFSFFNETEITCNLNNYRDEGHYCEQVNSQMLQWMSSSHDELSAENYEAYCKTERDFYTTYDYDSLFN